MPCATHQWHFRKHRSKKNVTRKLYMSFIRRPVDPVNLRQGQLVYARKWQKTLIWTSVLTSTRTGDMRGSYQSSLVRASAPNLAVMRPPVGDSFKNRAPLPSWWLPGTGEVRHSSPLANTIYTRAHSHDVLYYDIKNERFLRGTSRSELLHEAFL